MRVVNTNATLVYSSTEREPVDPNHEPLDDNKVGCLTCPVRRNPANMVNVYEGEYQCHECRWGL